jgi:hypothetical protein
MHTERQMRGEALLHIWAVAGLTLIVGLYLLLSMPVIERDGVVFIEFAKGLGQDPRAAIMNQYQHPGYPGIIWSAHGIARAMGASEGLMTWVYSAQAATLLFRVMAVVVLYRVGRRIAGARAAFIGSVLLAILPGMAEYGSDVLSDWPSMFFFSLAMLLLLRSVAEGPWWLFAAAGASAGVGYLVRPECAIVAAIAGMWAAWQVVTGRNWPRGRAVLAGVVLVAGFALPAAPYMAAKGAIFPKKHIGEFSAPAVSAAETPRPVAVAGVDAAGIVKVGRAVEKLFNRVGEMLSWFFLPMMVIGAIVWLRDPATPRPARFVAGWLMILTTLIVLWLHIRHGYISRRHILPMMAVCVCLVPIGLDALARWLSGRRDGERFARVHRRWVAVLLVAGTAICLYRLWGLADVGRAGYLKAAGWLRSNTPAGAVVAAEDSRIAFYAERKWLDTSGATMPPSADYLAVTGSKKGDDMQPSDETARAVFRYEPGPHGEVSVIIYRR